MQLTSVLLKCGAVAGPLYIVVGVAQVLTREGFDVRLHALSLLSNGELGWIQIANFVVSGALALAGAVGVRRALYPGRAGTWGPILLATWGIGLIGSGIFVADPALGFPAGTPMETPMTRSGMLHLVFGAFSFYALIAACLVFARRFATVNQRGWAAYSAFSGIAFFIAFGVLASGTFSPVTMLGLYAGVAWIWIWHSALMLRLLGEMRAAPVRAGG